MTEIGDLCVWHIPQVPMEAFRVSVDTVGEGVKLCRVLADYDDFQYAHRVKPDYCNAQGIDRWEEDGEGGFDWFSVDLEDGDYGVLIEEADGEAA